MLFSSFKKKSTLIILLRVTVLIYFETQFNRAVQASMHLIRHIQVIFDMISKGECLDRTGTPATFVDIAACGYIATFRHRPGHLSYSRFARQLCFYQRLLFYDITSADASFEPDLPLHVLAEYSLKAHRVIQPLRCCACPKPPDNLCHKRSASAEAEGVASSHKEILLGFAQACSKLQAACIIPTHPRSHSSISPIRQTQTFYRCFSI
jgi:hypothetical protein